MSKPQVLLVGSGHVGKALHEGLTRVGHAVAFAPKEQDALRAAARSADVVVLAIPHDARRDVATALGASADGKVVLDVTNPLRPGLQWVQGPTSAAEELQSWIPRAKVVKCFNTVFASYMPTGHIGREQLSALAASDDETARKVVLQMARDLGFDAVDAGPLAHARWLEELLFLEMLLGFKAGLGGGIGFRLVRAPPA